MQTMKLVKNIDEFPPDTPAACRPFRSRSFATCVNILARNALDVLEGRKLEWNEMTNEVTLDRVAMRDHEPAHIRAVIEEKFIGGVGPDGETIGMKQSRPDIADAMIEVALTHPYHPLRDYLTALVWDHVERLAFFADLLGAERSTLNQAILKRWFISCVARARRPGCKMDTVLILVGPQGHKKSACFRILGVEWWRDTAVDVHNKDTFQVLEHAWILEWSELESMRRAVNQEPIKAFLSSPVDTYCKRYAHTATSNPRSSVIVGTTNTPEFLSDETGSRRFWPIQITDIDLDGVSAQRDQLWAEAVVLYDAGEQWWLTPEEEQLLVPAHQAHTVTDAWEPLISRWLENRPPGSVSTAEILEHAIEKPAGLWSQIGRAHV